MTATDRKKIAIVEDSPYTAELMSAFLNELCDDFQVCHFSTGPAFLETYQRGVYRLVILDISLPEMDGFEILARIRLTDATIPVIAFTAHAGMNFHQRAVQAGFDDVVTKPVLDMDAFCQMIIEVADRHAA
jgi:CheY-like chemotaxis protein